MTLPVDPTQSLTVRFLIHEAQQEAVADLEWSDLEGHDAEKDVDLFAEEGEESQ